jgi:GT2 family glycosyltransferase
MYSCHLPLLQKNGLSLELSVVILNWNAHEDTIRCLGQLRSWRVIRTKVWIIDNASASQDAEIIASRCPEVEVVRSEENLGFAGGTNLGITKALTASEAPLLLLNNDVFVEETDVVRLLQGLRSKPNAGIVAPVLYHATEKQRILSAGSRNPVLHRFHTLYDIPNRNELYEVASVSGAAVIIRTAVFRDVGLLRESYYFGTELADLCRRASQKGYDSLIDPEAKAYHDIDRSSRLRETLYVYYVTRNRFLYIRNFHHLSSPFLMAIWAFYGEQQAFRLSRKGKRATAKAISMGVRDGLRGRFGGQNKRVLDACRDLANATNSGI